MGRINFLILGFSFLLISSAQAKEFSPKSDLIFGVFDFSEQVKVQKIAESAEKLKKTDSNFLSITVAEIHKNAYGIYFSYRSNDKINTPDKLVEMVMPNFKEYGKDFEGQHISNSTIVIK